MASLANVQNYEVANNRLGSVGIRCGVPRQPLNPQCILDAILWFFRVWPMRDDDTSRHVSRTGIDNMDLKNNVSITNYGSAPKAAC